MGAYYTFTAAWKTAKCIDVVGGLTDSLATPGNGNHSTPKTEKNVWKMTMRLHAEDVFHRTAGRSHPTYPHMASELL